MNFGMTLSSEDLLAWWPTCIQAYISHARLLQREVQQLRRSAFAAAEHAGLTLDAAMATVSTALPSDLPTAIQAVTTAHLNTSTYP